MMTVAAVHGSEAVTEEDQGGAAPLRFRHIAEHARGGMGRVILAYDTKLKRRVALKELLPSGNGKYPGRNNHPDAELKRRFLQEAHVMARLDHPGIVPVFEMGQRPDGRPFYVMRYVEGRTLHDAVHQAKGLQERLALLPAFLGICQAVAFAHSRGVLHRDLKPTNVLIGSFGEVLVIDWGLAKVADTDQFDASMYPDAHATDSTLDAVRTRLGQALGTPAYMPPEQAEGKLDAIDQRSDVYALGAVLYEILTGQSAFSGDSPMRIVAKVLNGPPQPAHLVDASVPRELSAICMRALCTQPDDRYQSAQELIEELTRFQSGALVDAHEYTATELAMRFVRRYRLPLAISAIALALLAIGGVISYANVVSARNAERAQRLAAERDNYYLNMRVAQINLDERRYDAAQEVLWNSPVSRRNWEWGFLLRNSNLEKALINVPESINDLSISPDGTLIGVATREGPCRVWTTWPMQEKANLLGHSAEAFSIAFSPDGKRVLTASKDNTARLWDSSTGECAKVFRGHPFALRAAAFCGDGTHVVTVSEDHTARIWDSATAKMIHVLEGHTTGISRLAVSSDGQYILTGDLNGGVWLWNEAAGGAIAELRGHNAGIEEMHFSHDGKLAVTTGREGRIFLWEIPSGQKVRELTGHRGAVLSADFSPDDSRLITGSDDMSARVWNVADGSLERKMLELRHDASVTRFTLDGHRMLAGTYSSLVRIWDSQDGAWLTTLGGGTLPVRRMVLGPDGRTVYAAMGYSLFVFDINYGDVRASLHGHTSGVIGVAFKPDGSELATFSGHSKESKTRQKETLSENSAGIRWTRDDFKAITTLPTLPSWVLSGAYLDSGLSVVTEDGRMWDVATGTAIRQFGNEDTRLLDAKFSPDGTRLLTSAEGVPGAKVWDVHSANLLCSVETDTNPVLSGVFSPDGRLIATTAGASPIYVADAATGSIIATLDSGQDWTISLAFSHDGKWLASGTGNNLDAHIWDLSTRSRIASLKGHRAPILHLAFSPDDSRIATAGSWDTAVRIWDPSTGAELVRLAGPEVVVQSCAWSPDGRQIISGYADGEALVWEAAPWREQDLPGDTNLAWKDRFYNVYRGEQMLNHSQYP